MAKKYYGIDIGEFRPSSVTTGASTTSKDVEIVVDQATTAVNKKKVLKAIEVIRMAVIKDTAMLS